MSTTTTILGLIKHVDADLVRAGETTDESANKDAIDALFHATTGHLHTGATTNGPKIALAAMAADAQPMTTAGDIIYGGTAGAPTRLAKGAAAYALLMMKSDGTVPVWGTAGQIPFPATAAPSADANTLDDYEEGTWTPTDASGATLAFTSVSGAYTKIGRLVIASAALTFPATADGTTASIGGLPFTVANVEAARMGFVSTKTEATLVGMVPDPNAVTIGPRTSTNGAITNATLSSDTMYFCAVYYIA